MLHYTKRIYSKRSKQHLHDLSLQCTDNGNNSNRLKRKVKEQVRSYLTCALGVRVGGGGEVRPLKCVFHVNLTALGFL